MVATPTQEGEGMPPKGRVFSGMRPTGRLHIGNYLGALQNWVALQEEYECIYCVVDVHALTTMKPPETQHLPTLIREMVLDWLGAGLDPHRSILFVQSHVPEVMTLHTLLSMVTPLGWLLRVPTFKEKVRQMAETEESVNYGLVGYPVLMTADILLYKADTVPVGEDQLPHLELAREIVRRFNALFGPTFPEPQAKLTEAPLVLGLDGKQKMSKSLDNHVEIAATPEEVRSRVLRAFTDPERLRRDQPGRPWVCNVYTLHGFFNPTRLRTVYEECTTARRGCVECKGELGDAISAFFAPFRERRAGWAAQPHRVDEVLREGAHRARVIARATLAEVRERMGLGHLPE
jgi:tryptophanyl-tRNA synthetase